MINIIWKPQEGSQELFLSCPIEECLYEGTRGPGKTDALLMDYLKDVSKGYGAAWQGILFRQTCPQLSDIIKKSLRWIPQIFPKAKYNKSTKTWIFPDGEQLLFRHIIREDDYWNYHGHEYPWIGFEELTTWPDDKCYLKMHSVNRCSVDGVPKRIRATCNPYGVGHNWVKRRFIDPAPAGEVIVESFTDEIHNVKHLTYRTRLHGTLSENKILQKADPTYITKLLKGADANLIKAWLEGSWDITSGGMFDDLWDKDVHVIPKFEIPGSWIVDRCFDWGSSKPFAVLWVAESDGTEFRVNGKLRCVPRGSLFVIREWYGTNGNDNEGLRMTSKDIARGIKEREAGTEYIVNDGPADSSIYTTEDGHCIADDMADEGVTWEHANKGPGTRISGWQTLRQLLFNTKDKDLKLEEPHLYIFDTCRHTLRTLPSLPRDQRNQDDVDTNAEDHIADTLRYRVLTKAYSTTIGRYGR